MWVPVFFPIFATLHTRRRNGPKCVVQIDLRPLSRAQLARALKQQGSQLQRRSHNGAPAIGLDGAQQMAKLLRVGNGREVLATIRRQRTFEICSYVARHAAGRHAVAPHLAAEHQASVGGLYRPTRFDLA